MSGTGTDAGLHPPVILPARTLAARLRSLLLDRTRFSESLARESQALLDATRALLGDARRLGDAASAPQMERWLAGARREEATLTAELCDTAITPLDGEDLRALACSLTAVLEALDDVQAAACRPGCGPDGWPLGALCQATLDYIEAICDLVPEPHQLTADPARHGVLASRTRALRTARRACEAALLAGAALEPGHVQDPRQFLARWSLIEEFRRLRVLLDAAVTQLRRVVLKNS